MPLESSSSSSSSSVSSGISCRLSHNGVAASSSCKVLVCLPSPPSDKQEGDDDDKNNHKKTCEIVYASHAMVNVARRTMATIRSQPASSTLASSPEQELKEEPIWNVYHSLRTSTTAPSSTTNTTSAASGTARRVVTSLARLRRSNNKEQSVSSVTTQEVLVSAFSDGTVTSWVRSTNEGRDDQWEERILLHESSLSTTHAEGGDGTKTTTKVDPMMGRSITDMDGCCRNRDASRMCVVTCTSAGAVIYDFQTTKTTESSTKAQPLLARHSLLSVPSNAVRLHPLRTENNTSSNNNNDDGMSWLILIGTAAPRHNRIHVFLMEWDREATITTQPPLHKPVYCGALTGHEDWITCFDWFPTTGNSSTSTAMTNAISSDMLASGSQDAKIRLWKFSTTTTSSPLLQPESDAPLSLQEPLEDMVDEDDNEEDEEEEEEGESRLEILHNSNHHDTNTQRMTSVTLEALLIGHEEHVTSVQWHPNPQHVYGQDLILISSSMDRAMFLWSAHENGVWTPISRVGSAGGILGGSIGSTLLGFVNTALEPEQGRWLVGHAYGGALHFFSCEPQHPLLQDDSDEKKEASEQNTMTIEERASLTPWRAQPCITGHFDGVTDLSWEAENGDYLLTVSNDQTCRLWTTMASSAPHEARKQIWIEIARPQVHGYNLSAVASLSSVEYPHLLVSGADEKELRAFDATKGFLRQYHLVSSLAGRDQQSENNSTDSKTVDGIDRVERAYIPSLGLTTKASAADGADEDTGNASESSTQLPLERDLGAVSLWPEIRKLYGHNTELTRLCSTVSARTSETSFASSPYSRELFVASSAKARTVEDACIRLWNVKDSRCVQVLAGGHKSTVAALAFSPDGKYLASSGKDRRLCVWRRTLVAEPSALPLSPGGDGVNPDKTGPFFLAAASDTAHTRIIWGVHFCPFDPTILASGARDGTVKIWKITDAVVDGKAVVSMKEMFSFSPMSKTTTNKAESVTSVSFAPLGTTSRAILALGLENGMIELWGIPLNEGDGASPDLLLCFPPDLCHIATVTKLAWRPHRRPPYHEKDTMLYLASSSMDYACRIFDVKIGPS